MDIVKQITSVFTLHMILFSMAVLTGEYNIECYNCGGYELY